MRFVWVLRGVAMFAALTTSALAVPAPQSNTIDANQLSLFQQQAAQLAGQIKIAIAQAEADAAQKKLSPADTQAAIQAAIQSTITASGFDPRVVLAAIEALQTCRVGTDFIGQPISVACLGLTGQLSQQARAALDSVHGVVASLVNGNSAPGAIGGNGPAAFTSGPAPVGGGGGTGYR
jgi:hypothetical protein